MPIGYRGFQNKRKARGAADAVADALDAHGHTESVSAL